MKTSSNTGPESFRICRVRNENPIEVVKFQVIAKVLFVTVHVAQKDVQLYYLVIPDAYLEKDITEREVPQYGVFAGTFSNELVTLTITNYFPYVRNRLYLALVGDGCIRKMIRRRFIP